MTNFSLGVLHISLLPEFQQSIATSVLFLLIIAAAGLVLRVVKSRAPLSLLRRCAMATVNVLSVIALLLLLSDIRISTSEPQAVILVTPGTSAADLEKLEARSEQHIYWLNEKPQPEFDGNPRAGRQIDNIEQLAILEDDLRSLKVLGEGLNQQQWLTLDTLSRQPIQVDFIPAPLPSGLINMGWRSSVVLGESIDLAGQIAPLQTPSDNLAATIFTLVLHDPAGQEVLRRTVKAGDEFKMSFAPPSIGRWLYQLSMLNHLNEVVEKQSLAISVRAGHGLSLLIRQSAPSFESRAVKDWLSQVQGSARIETQISQQKWMAQNIGYDGLKSATSSLLDTPELLKAMDLAILDGRALNALQPDQRENLTQAIEQGLGLLILADPSLIADDATLQQLSGLRLQSDPSIETKMIRLSWDGVASEQPMSVFAAAILGTPQYTLVSSLPGGDALVAAQQRGLGRIGLSLVSTTYQWPTQGETNLFDRYWQYVIQHIARPVTHSNWLENSLPYFNQTSDTLTPCALTTSQSQESTILNARYIDPEGRSVALNLEPTFIDPLRQCSIVKPALPGWYQLRLSDGAQQQSSLDFYVYDKDQWLNWQRYEKHQASDYRQSRNSQETLPTSYQSVDKWLLWVGFILLCSILWWEQKRLRQSRQ